MSHFFTLLFIGGVISLFNYALNRESLAYTKNIEQLEKHCEKIRGLFVAWSQEEAEKEQIAAHINALLMFTASLRTDRHISGATESDLLFLTSGDFGKKSSVDKLRESNAAIALIYTIQFRIQNHLRQVSLYRRLRREFFD